uniref:Uncharacterized protein n=1 Tax=Solanum lycopersicum TaxID=4081 RepID=A0A3Q7FX62_SOLLC
MHKYKNVKCSNNNKNNRSNSRVPNFQLGLIVSEIHLESEIQREFCRRLPPVAALIQLSDVFKELKLAIEVPFSWGLPEGKVIKI